MKILIEQSDIEEVKTMAKDCYNVILTDEEAKNILESNRIYAGLCYAWGITDTEMRESLGKILKKTNKI